MRYTFESARVLEHKFRCNHVGVLAKTAEGFLFCMVDLDTNRVLKAHFLQKLRDTNDFDLVNFSPLPTDDDIRFFTKDEIDALVKVIPEGEAS